MADEQRVPGMFAKDPDRQAMFLAGAAEEVLGEERGVLRLGEEVGLEEGEMLGRHRPVVFPPHRVLGGGVAHHELVLGGAAGMLPGRDDQRPMFGGRGLASLNGDIIELSFTEIALNAHRVHTQFSRILRQLRASSWLRRPLTARKAPAMPLGSSQV